MCSAADSPDGSRLSPSCKRGKDGRRGPADRGDPAGWLGAGWGGLRGACQASCVSLVTTKGKVTFKEADGLHGVSLICSPKHVRLFRTLYCCWWKWRAAPRRGGEGERWGGYYVHEWTVHLIIDYIYSYIRIALRSLPRLVGSVTSFWLLINIYTFLKCWDMLL